MAFDISNMTEEEKKEALKALQDDANAKKRILQKELILMDRFRKQ